MKAALLSTWCFTGSRPLTFRAFCSANRSVVSISRRNNAIQSRDAVSSNYRFHGIEVLEKFSDADKARDILNQLANDRGILAVMEKHKCVVVVSVRCCHTR